MTLAKHLKDPLTQDRLVFLVLAMILAVPFIKPLGLPMNISPMTRAFYQVVENVPKGGVIVADCFVGLGNWFDLGAGEVAFYRHAFKLARERNVKFVCLSTSFQPDAVFIIENILNQYVDKTGLKYGENYVFLGWNPSFEAAQAGIVQDLYKTYPTDRYGTPIEQIPMMKNIRSIKDYSLLFFSTGRDADTWVRQWSEVAKNNKVPILMNALSATVSVSTPYVGRGLLSGYLNAIAGAAEYELLLKMPGMGVAFADGMSLAHILAAMMVIAATVIFWVSRVRRGQ